MAAVDPASLDQLADFIRTWFHRKEARGNHCIVETFRRAVWTTSSPIPKTILSSKSNGWMVCLAVGRTIPPLRWSMSILNWKAHST